MSIGRCIGRIYINCAFKIFGCHFKFFHRVENLHIGADGRSIESVSIAQQATPIGDYNPLYDVKGLPSEEIIRQALRSTTH